MESAANEINCKHFVIRKKRYCRMTVKQGEEYCGEHQPNNPESNAATKDDSRRRVVCPLDSKHTCYANKLKQHLKKCNAKPTPALPYICKNVNTGEALNYEIKSRSLSSIAAPQLLQVISKVNRLHNEVAKEMISEKFLTHSILQQELSNPEYGNLTRKHLIQTSAILGLMQNYNLFEQDTCYVEFGAGKGKLSYWLAKTLESVENCSSVLLVERASHRHKYDNKLDKSNGTVLRIRADIADLVLSKVEAVNKAKHVVGVTKHLCGDATDLALRCLQKCQEAGNNVAGFLMAFCCHHRCQWGSYTGKEYFEEIGLLQSDFDVMCGLVSWAVCGTGQSREHRANHELLLTENSRYTEIGLKRKEKEEIGKKCKDLLNWGRKMFIQNLGFTSHLCYYVDSNISLENVCLIGNKKN